MAIKKAGIPEITLSWSPSSAYPILQLTVSERLGVDGSGEYAAFHSIATWSKTDDPKEVQEYLLDLSHKFANLSNELAQAALEAGPFLAGEMGVCASSESGTLTASPSAAPCR